MITNEQVTERVMRMGLEGRVHDLDKLFDIARQQLKNRKAESSVKGDLATWMQQQSKFAFMYIEGVLTVVRVGDLTGLKIVEWRSPNWPLVERLH